MRSTRPVLLVALLTMVLAGCSSANPQLNVVGVGQAQTRGAGPEGGKMLVVYVEVVNKTERDLELSRLEYQMATESWFSSKGEVRLRRQVTPNSTAVVEIPVPYKARKQDGEVAYTFKAKLFAQDAHVERSWKLRKDGTLSEGSIAVGPVGVRTRIAGQDD